MFAGAATPPNQLTAAERASGWQLLFDGHSSSGWKEITGKPFPDSWRVEDGCLRSVLLPSGAQDIRTVDEFDSFDLQFEWKLRDRGNSGLKYLVQHVDEWNNAKGRQARARGLEYQLADDLEPDAASDPRRVAGSLYSLIAPAPKITPHINEFNQSRIVVQGNHVEHWLNGTRVVSFDLQAPAVDAAMHRLAGKDVTALRRSSPISLQNHSSDVWFRSIRIRRLHP